MINTLNYLTMNLKIYTQRIQSLCCLVICLMLTCSISFGQSRQVIGKVTDLDGKAIPSVNVLLKGTTKGGTVTDANGNYKISTPDANATLVYSFVGYESKEEKVGVRATIDVKLRESDESLSDVFITATSQPVRKLETITAVESIGPKQIERTSPINLVDIVRYTPGIYVQTQAGRTRNFIFMRGFPDAGSNGLIYSSLLMDGLRTFASPEMVPDAAFRYDLNVEKVEVVRGSAATLYGRGAAAGAINVISKMGGTEQHGAARMMFSNRNMLQADINLNGSLNESKTLRYNIGGFVLSDGGFRDNLFTDNGGQIRANVDWLMPEDKGSLRITGGFIDLRVQNQIDIPYAANDLSKPASNWTSSDVTLPKDAFKGRTYNVNYPDGFIETVKWDEVAPKGNFSKGWNLGAKLKYDLGNGWTLNNNARFQKMLVGIGFDFGNSANFGASQGRIFFGGGKTGGGSNSQDFIDELRFNKTIENDNSKHNLTFGYYFSTINVKAASEGLLYGITTADKNNRILSGFPGVGAQITSLFRNGVYNESVHSVFVGDEAKFGENLIVNAGIRQDWINLDLSEDRYQYQKTLNAGSNPTRQVKHKGLNYSTGLNFLTNEKSAIYGNYIHAYRAPDYSSYTTVVYGFKLPDGSISPLNSNAATAATAPQLDAQGRPIYTTSYIDDNEIINSFEVGYRTSFGDFGFDGGLFYNTIKNRLVSTFIGATAVSEPTGDNLVKGGEFSLTWTPRSIKGLYMRTSITSQSATYTKYDYKNRELDPATNTTVTKLYDLTDNKVANVPPTIWNFSIGYEAKQWGFNFNNNYLGERPADAFNTMNYNSYSLVDANLYWKEQVSKTSTVKVKFSFYNLLNNQSASNVISAATDNAFLVAKRNNYAGNFANVRGVPLIPRRGFLSLEFNF